jgi:hypothetical protein
MDKKPQFEYDKESGLSVCTLIIDNNIFTGIAQCHPEDMDMESEKVGCELAYRRAIIEALRHRRDNIIKPSLQALKQLYYSMEHSKKFNKYSYENKRLWGQINNWKCDLDTINKMIAAERKFIKQYIDTKEELYKNIRINRANGQK